MAQPIADEFASSTRSDVLIDDLRARIAGHGPITFREFMEAALYHPEHGYYTTHADAAGRGGDYLTSPEIHPIFGVLVGKQLWQMWDALARPRPFDVVELGGGGGLLTRDILLWAARREPAFSAALRYRIVERSPAMLRRQRRTFEDAGVTVEQVSDLPGGVAGCIVSNEFFDALPFHRVLRRDGELREVYVTWADGRFADEIGQLSEPGLAHYFADAGVMPGEGCFAEVNIEASRWIADAAAALARGYVLTFDYGYEWAGLFAPWRRDGTLLCFYRQSASSDPYQRVGEQDVTASVDFTALRRAAVCAGLRTLGVTDQAAFLTRLGVHTGLAAIASERPDDIEEYYARRRAVIDLTDGARLGRIRVMAQGKDVPDAPLWGFADAG